MSDAIQTKLEEAYELIRQERVEEAQLVLQPVIFGNPSADAWWLWANAVTEPADARHALSKVLELDPDHEQAQVFLAKLDELYPQLPEADVELFGIGASEDFDDLYGDTDAQPPIQADIPTVVPPSSETDTASEDEIRQLDLSTETSNTAVDFSGWLEDLAESESASTELPADQPELKPAPVRSYALRNILLVLLVLAVGIGLAFVLLLSQQSGISEPQIETLYTEMDSPSDTLKSVLDATQRGAEAESALLGGEPETKLIVVDDSSALLIRVCRGTDVDMPAAMQHAMALAARYGISAQDELLNVGAAMVNCERQDTLIEAFTSIENAAAYASGRLSPVEFSETWASTPE